MYTVKILPSEEFDKLPFERAREALGAADPKTGIAYVRDTGYNDITKHTIEHELDELMASVSPHEENGIRYKIPIIGPLFTAAATGAKALGSAALTGAKAIGGAALKGAQSVGNFLTPGPAIFGPAAQAGAASGAANALAPLAQSGYNPSAAAAAGGGNIFSAFGSKAAGALAPLAQSGYNPSAAASANPLEMFSATRNVPVGKPSILGSAMNMAKNVISGQSPFASAMTQPSKEGSATGNIMDQFGKMIPGAAVSLLGNLFAPKVEAPDFSGITDPLRSRLLGEEGFGGPAFDLGFGEAKRVIDAPLGEVPEEVFGQSEKIRDQQLADDLTQLRNQFKALNPTADVDNNSAYLREKSRLEERAREDKANSRAALSFDYTNQEMQRRLSTMQTLLNLDSAQTEQLISLAQLDVAEIMMKTGINAQEATEIKQLFGSFGEMMMRSQLPQGGVA